VKDSPEPAAGCSAARATAATAKADWVSTCSSPANGGTEIYVARSTIRKSGDLVKMWDMWDLKIGVIADGKRSLSVKSLAEYDCKGARRRVLSNTGYSGHMGNGAEVGFHNTPFPWERVSPGDMADACYWKYACAKK
jgi:hypothetical protein